VAQLAILLCTFNGVRFLPQQLASYERQSFGDWCLTASDDGSTDALFWQHSGKDGAPTGSR
jgi:glycosyltransferase involved in cell wall biosynthesis